MAQNEKAQARLRPEVSVPVIASGAGHSLPEEGDEEWNDEIDEVEPEEAEESFEDELWDDDVLDVEDAHRATATAIRASGAASGYKSLGPRKSIAKLQKKDSKPRAKSTGLKKGSLKKSKELDVPPTPLGCEWRDAEDGWSLWRCWSERDEVIGGKYKKERYAGYLSRGAWGVMKQYDYETFIAVIGRRFRRHSGR